MKNLTKKVELFSNIAIIVVAILLCAVLVKRYLLTQPVQSNSNATANSAVAAGTKVNLQDIDWSKGTQTLIMALSNSCHFCSASAPFYQRLAQKRDKTRLIAVLPQSVEEGKKYLDGLKITVDDMKQVPLASLGVTGTPTLILVDSKGVIINSWVGKLPADREQEVLASLQ